MNTVRCRGTKYKRVTPSFIRSIRKAYLNPDGTPTPGNEGRVEVLLKVAHSVQRGDYKWGMGYAKRNGIDLETMYRDYSRLILGARRDVRGLLQGIGRFCTNHNFGVEV